jgi:hypothetical protein
MMTMMMLMLMMLMMMMMMLMIYDPIFTILGAVADTLISALLARPNPAEPADLFLSMKLATMDVIGNFFDFFFYVLRSLFVCNNTSTQVNSSAYFVWFCNQWPTHAFCCDLTILPTLSALPAQVSRHSAMNSNALRTSSTR